MSQQLEFFEIPSPCVRTCITDEKGFCLGCMRSRQERFEWLTMTDAEKQNVLRLCRQRYLRKHRKQAEKVVDDFDQPTLF